MEIHVDHDSGETVIHTDRYDPEKANKNKKLRFLRRVADVLDSSLSAIMVILYIILSLTLPNTAPSGFNNWAIYWTLIFLGSIPGGILRTIAYRDLNKFPIVQMACFAYLFTGMYTGIFHPTWVILLAIPAYYAIFSPIQRLVKDTKEGKI